MREKMDSTSMKPSSKLYMFDAINLFIHIQPNSVIISIRKYLFAHNLTKCFTIFQVDFLRLMP